MKRLSILAALLAVQAVLLMLLLKVTGLPWETVRIEFDPAKTVRLLLLAALFVAGQFSVFLVCVRQTAGTHILRNAVLVLSAVGTALICLEAVFMYIPKSHRLGEVTLAHKMWMQRYWGPVNAAGFRDDEYDPAGEAGKALIYVIGDSFVAGHGIKDYRDRFSNRLQTNLDGKVRVLNMGVNGFSSKHQAYLLKKYFDERRTPKPKLVVLSYYGNDIMPNNETLYTTYQGLPAWQAYVVKNSYLANYVYWLYEHAETYDYVDYLAGAYNDPAQLLAHLRYLQLMQELCRREGVPLVVVVFPFLADLDASEIYTGKVKRFFAAQGVPVIDVAALVRDIPVKKRIVNVNDHHPSPLVHRRVADKLQGFLTNKAEREAYDGHIAGRP